MGAPVLKKPITPVPLIGGPPSNRKLYKVPQRIAFAFGFWAKVSVYQDAVEPTLTVQGALL